MRNDTGEGSGLRVERGQCALFPHLPVPLPLCDGLAGAGPRRPMPLDMSDHAGHESLIRIGQTAGHVCFERLAFQRPDFFQTGIAEVRDGDYQVSRRQRERLRAERTLEFAQGPSLA